MSLRQLYGEVIMDKEQLKQFLSENSSDEDVQSVLSEYAPKPKLEDLLSSEEYSKKFQSLLDSEKSKAVESFKQNTLPQRVEERVKEELSKKDKKDPWQIKLEEMEQKQSELMKQLEDKERAENRERLRNKAFKTVTEKNLPSDLVDYFLGEDEETTMENLKVLEETLSSYEKKVKNSVYRNKNTDIPSSKEADGSSGDKPSPDASKEEWMEYYRKHKS